MPSTREEYKMSTMMEGKAALSRAEGMWFWKVALAIKLGNLDSVHRGEGGEVA